MPRPESKVRQLRVMISSTRADLDQYRSEASQIITRIADEKRDRVQLLEMSMEHEPQTGNREFAVEISKKWVEDSDWLILIVGCHYGTISDEPGADGLSVTEWEYRHAWNLREKKKIFAFIAGPPETPDEYRCTSEEKKDLKDWIRKQKADQQAKLDAFKELLTKRHAGLFANLKMFRERLEATLRRAVDDLPPDFEPGTPLAELIVAVIPAIRACIQKVGVVANCKEIHDQLHELRQNVLRPLREEVLPLWKQEGRLSDSKKAQVMNRVVKRAKQIGALTQARKEVDPGHQGLLYSVDGVLESPELWELDEEHSGPEPSLEQFTETVETFADAVQQAFSEADRSMMVSEGQLRDHYQTLRAALSRGRLTMGLSPADQRRLDEELRTLDSHRDRVRNTLAFHHSWQEAHDKLEEVGGFRDSEAFERKLKQYRGPALKKLLDLIEQELAVIGEADADDRQRLEGSLIKLKAAIGDLQADASVHVFDEMRKPFDDAFYVVDHRTMREVDRAKARVVGIEQWLDGLTKAQQEVI